MRLRSFMLLTITASLASAQTSQIRRETIRGRVTTDSGVAIAGADVIVTMAPSAETFSTLTSPTGQYSISIPNGTGEYLVYVGALGRRSFKQRVTRTGADTLFTLDAKLAVAVAKVAAVSVQAQHVRPTRAAGTDGGTGTNGMDKTADGVTGALPPELEGNLDAMASMIPGLSVTPNGPSAFGLGADNNQTTLNGLAFGGADLPRDAKTTTRFQLSPWDPSNGGFAGALVAVTMVPGDNVAARRGHVTFDTPALQVSDPLASRTGQRFSNLQVSEGGSGPLVLDKVFYNYGGQVSRYTASVASLSSLDASALTHAGLAPDSAARLLQILGAEGVPLRAGGVPDARTTTMATFMERIDHAPSSVITGRAPSQTWSVTGYGRYVLSEAGTLTPTTTPAFSGKSANAIAALQGIYSSFFGANGQYLNETTSGITVSGTRGTPYLDLPGGNVLVPSLLPDGTNSLGSASFGGNSGLATQSKSWTWETVNQTTFMPVGLSTLPLHLTLQARYTGFSQSLSANRLGRFDFASLSDLAAGRPSAFSRTLNAPNESGGEWVGAAALGGSWTRGRVVWTGGARIDANVFTAAPQFNPDVERAFAARTDHAPNDVGLSPRVGFNWYYTGKKPGAFGYTRASEGTFYRGTSQLRGGIGEFRNALPATLLADAIGSTGLAGASQQLRCVGSAAPAADWHAFVEDEGNIPDRCAGGASAFTDSARVVSLFDRSYTAPRTWKGTLGWTHWNDAYYLAIDATYAMNLHQPGVVDLNFAGTPAFALDGEHARPVFVAPAAVVSSTGTASAIGSRSVSAFGRVSDRVSDLRGDARQVSVYLLPGALVPFQFGIVTLAYTYVDARSQARGFDQSANGDPRNIEWARVMVPRHQVVAQAYHFFNGPGLTVTAAFRASSGLPYTPIVSGDINGDGVSGDRAFVFDPATHAATDAAVATGVRDLLTSGSSSARACLARQLGQIAGRNSCVSPWNATMNAGITYAGTMPSVARRARVSLRLVNVFAAVDALAHGTDHLRGWGAAPFPDPVLYRVTGFDASTRRFLYDVNGRFGSATPATTTLRAPFRLSLDVALDLGRSAAAQRLEQNLRVRPGLTGTRAPVDTIKKRYMAGFSDIYGAMLRLSDSLVLSGDQIQRIQQQRIGLQGRADSLYADLSTYLSSLPPNYDGEAAVARVDAATDAMWQAIYDEVPFLKTLLSRGQIKRLPAGMQSMITIPNWRGRFFFAT